MYSGGKTILTSTRLPAVPILSTAAAAARLDAPNAALRRKNHGGKKAGAQTNDGPLSLGYLNSSPPSLKVPTIFTTVSGIPPHLKQFFAGRRILVVDDFELIHADLRSNLERFFPEVTTIADPLKVIDVLQEARKKGKPFDAMVLDLMMPQKNGDELLRDLAEAQILIPVVIHSGSHAGGLQTSLFPQIDAARTDIINSRIAELAEAEASFENIKTAKDLEHWKRLYARATDGVPMAFVEKRVWADGNESLPHATHAMALARVIAAGGETNWPQFNNVVKNFRPALLESGEMTDYIEALVQGRDLVVGTAKQVKREIDELNIPGLKESRPWMRFNIVANELMGPEFSYRALSGEIDPIKAGFARHNLMSALFAFADIFDILLSDADAPFGDQVRNNEGIMVKIEYSDSIVRQAVRTAQMIQAVKKPVTSVNVNMVVDAILWNSSRSQFVKYDGELLVASPNGLFDPTIEQPIMNAEQWNRKELGPILVQTSLTPVFQLNARSQDYFKTRHGLTDTDEVVTIKITDHGPGIPPENLAKIFEMGFTTRNGGTGQGLALLAKHIGALNGTFFVESTVGVGTTFYMHFLRAKPVSNTTPL